jgi:hypothetical protein
VNVTVPHDSVVNLLNSVPVIQLTVESVTGTPSIVAHELNQVIVHHAKSYHDCAGLLIVHVSSYINGIVVSADP